MKTILMLLLLFIPVSSWAKPIRAQTLREQVITALKVDRETMIVTIEQIAATGEQADAMARFKARVANCEARIKELGGSFEPWAYTKAAAPLKTSGMVPNAQDPAAVQVWQEGYPYPSSMPHGVGGGK